MPIPGLIQLILTLGFMLAGFVGYLQEPKRIVVVLFVALFLSVTGLLNILLGNSQTATEILLFQAKDFYIGTASLSCGIGLFVGALAAWVALAVRRLWTRT